MLAQSNVFQNLLISETFLLPRLSFIMASKQQQHNSITLILHYVSTTVAQPKGLMGLQTLLS